MFLNRYQMPKGRTIGKFIIPGVINCFSLEDEDRFLETGGFKFPGKTAIPRGRFRVTIDWSERSSRLAIHILDVPQFEGIRIEAGNKPEDTAGCVLVGLDVLGGELIQSVAALKIVTIAVLGAILRREEVWITIE